MDILTQLKTVNDQSTDKYMLPLLEGIDKKTFDKFIGDMKFGIELETVYGGSDSYEFKMASRKVNDLAQANFQKYHTVVTYRGDELPAIQMLAGYEYISFNGSPELIKQAEEYIDEWKSGASKTVRDLVKFWNKNSNGGRAFYGEYGGYRGHRNKKSVVNRFLKWCIEYDISIYAITPISLEAAPPALTFEELIVQVPFAVKRLRKLGFTGAKGVGFHINVSHKRNLSALAIENAIDNLWYQQGFSTFATGGYLFGQEALAMYGKKKDKKMYGFGDIARREGNYSMDFPTSIIEGYWDSLINQTFIKLHEIAKFVAPKLQGKTGVRYFLNVPVLPFVYSKDFPDSAFGSLNQASDSYIDDARQGRHSRSTSGRGQGDSDSSRIELRGLGGARAFKNLSTAGTLKKIIALAVTQMLPYLDNATVETKDILRTTAFTLQETVVKVLDQIFADYRAYKDPRSTTAPKKFSSSELISKFDNTTKQEIKTAFVDNTVMGVELNPGGRDWGIRAIKGNVHHKIPDVATTSALSGDMKLPESLMYFDEENDCYVIDIDNFPGLLD